MGVPASLPGRGGGDRRLPRRVRAAVGGSGAGARDPALDRPVLGEERGTLAAQRLARAQLCRAARWCDRDASRRVVRPARRIAGPDQPARRRRPDGPAGSGRRTARRADLALGPDEGHGRSDGRLRGARRSVARRAPAPLRSRGHRRRRRPRGRRGARRVHRASGGSCRTPRAAASTSPASPWPIPTRTRRS